MSEPSVQTDSAAALRTALSEQGILLGHHENVITSMAQQQTSILQTLTQLSHQVQQLSAKFSVSSSSASASPSQSPAPVAQPPPAAFRDAASPPPEPFSGELGKCRGFVLQCSLVFRRSPQSFPDDASKISYIIGLLRDKALRWAEAIIDEEKIYRYSYDDFLDLFKQTFSPKISEEEAAKKLWTLKQGNRSAAELVIEFRTLAADSGWNAPALKGAFLHALCEKLKDELASRDEPDTLDDLIALAIRIDNRLRERNRLKPQPSQSTFRSEVPLPQPPVNPSPLPPQEPMQISHVHLTPEERQRRINSGSCLYCGSPDHFLPQCPVRPKARARQ